MKLKNKARLLKELADSSDSPKDFIYYVMALQNQTAFDVAEKAGITPAHFYVAMSQVERGSGIGVQLCCKLSQGLDIDPYILNRIVADYNLKMYHEGKRKK